MVVDMARCPGSGSLGSCRAGMIVEIGEDSQLLVGTVAGTVLSSDDSGSGTLGGGVRARFFPLLANGI